MSVKMQTFPFLRYNEIVVKITDGGIKMQTFKDFYLNEIAKVVDRHPNHYIINYSGVLKSDEVEEVNVQFMNELRTILIAKLTLDNAKMKGMVKLETKDDNKVLGSYGQVSFDYTSEKELAGSLNFLMKTLDRL